MVTIGISTRAFPNSRWYEDVKKSGFSVIEISRRKSAMFFNGGHLNHIMKHLDGLDLSFHSGTMNLFHEDEVFTDTELALLKGEIRMARYLGVTEIVFHLTTRELEPEEIDRFKDLITLAEADGIDLIYEGNPLMKADTVRNVLHTFPRLKFNLDFGHLNYSHTNHALGEDILPFVRSIRDRITYIHVHNNNGLIDQHFGLEQGTLEYKPILDELDTDSIKLNIKTNTIDQASRTRDLLLDYLEGR